MFYGTVSLLLRRAELRIISLGEILVFVRRHIHCIVCRTGRIGYADEIEY